MCKAGGFDKTAIGAIRVRDNESFVEIAESAADGFVAAIGPGMTLEDGIKVAALDTAPDFGPARPRAPREDRPSREDRPARKPREDYKPIYLPSFELKDKKSTVCVRTTSLRCVNVRLQSSYSCYSRLR